MEKKLYLILAIIFVVAFILSLVFGIQEIIKQKEFLNSIGIGALISVFGIASTFFIKELRSQ
jgi:quinol-cytochrome oxidoreductase complex cytochrome b subunit